MICCSKQWKCSFTNNGKVATVVRNSHKMMLTAIKTCYERLKFDFLLWEKTVAAS